MSKAAPYLAVDFDVLERCGPAGKACGLSRADVFMGLGDMWQFCWREKTDIVTTTHILGFFGGVNACEALLAFKFIEASPDGWRVKGADRWLFIQKARSENGKANAGNLRQGTKPGTKSPALPEGSREGAGAPSPALTASSVQRTTTDLKDLSPKKPATPANPRLEPLKLALVADYLDVRGEKYRHSGPADTQGLKSLLPLADDARIRQRWREALRRTEYPRVSSFAQLASKWTDLAAPTQAAKGSAIHGQSAWGPNDDFLAGLSGGTS